MRSCSRPARSAARRRPRSRRCSTASISCAGRDGRRSQGRAGRARRDAALPAARRRRRDRAVQLPAPPVSRARRARRCSRATRSSIKPSDITPLCGQRYAEAAHAAELPAGVLNVVAGTGEVGAAMVARPRRCAACASPAAGRSARRILEAALDRPELLVALEMGGKNACVVLDDCRAAPGGARGRRRRLPVGGPALHRHRARARASQDRGSLHRRARARRARAAVRQPRGSRACSPGRSRRTARSPRSTARSRPRSKGGAEPIVAGAQAAGRLLPHARRCTGCPTACTTSPATPIVEVFGPDLCVEVIDSDEEAIAVLEREPVRLRQRGVHRRRTRASSEFCARTQLGHAQPQPLDEPREPEAAVRRRRAAAATTGRPARGRIATSTAPVAMLENVLGAVTPHPQLATLPAARSISTGSRRSTPPRKRPRRRAGSSTCRARWRMHAPARRRAARERGAARAAVRRRSRAEGEEAAGVRSPARRPGRGWCRSTTSRWPCSTA